MLAPDEELKTTDADRGRAGRKAVRARVADVVRGRLRLGSRVGGRDAARCGVDELGERAACRVQCEPPTVLLELPAT
jgi:hypothetical protein